MSYPSSLGSFIYFPVCLVSLLLSCSSALAMQPTPSEHIHYVQTPHMHANAHLSLRLTKNGASFLAPLRVPLLSSLRKWDSRIGVRKEVGGVVGVSMGKKGGGGGNTKSPKIITGVKAGYSRADKLLVLRGLADNVNHAMALILKGVVIADEGKVKITSAGQAVPTEVTLRLKISEQTKTLTRATGTLTRETTPPDSTDALGFRTSAEERGVIVAHHGSRVTVERLVRSGLNDGEKISCAVTPILKEKGLLTGDQVTFCEIVEGDNMAMNNTAGRKGVLVDRLERWSLLERPANAFSYIDPANTGLVNLGGEKALAAGGGSKQMCANVDQMIIVIAPRPLAPPLLLDTHICAAENSGIKPVIVLNKVDLVGEAAPEGSGAVTLGELLPDLSVYEALGYPVVRMSTKVGMAGMADLQAILRGKVSIMVGQSGVGKSSLVNMLLPNEKMRVGDLSEASGLGAHTTSHAELHHIPSGGDLIDCAGFRDFGTWHYTNDEIQMGFKEIYEQSLQCKYRNCVHWKEPDCAVKAAVEKGTIAQSRLDAFHEIRGLP